MNELKNLQDIKNLLRRGAFSVHALEHLDTLIDLAYAMGERNQLQEQLNNKK